MDYLNSTTDLSILVSDINKRRKPIRNFYDYYEGNTKITFMGDSLQRDFGKKLTSLSVNRCQPIIDLTLDRLQISGFEDTDDGGHSEDAQQLWEDLGLEEVAEQVHYDALTSGDGWLLAWMEGNQVQVQAQEPTQIAVLWNAEFPDVIEVAAKTWQRADGTWRLNLYYKNRLEKFVSTVKGTEPPENQNAWEHYQDVGDIAWPVKHDFGRVPLFHFAVKHRSGAYGTSDLEPIIPLQQRLNQTLANQAVAEEFQSYRQRWATGMQLIKDEETGQFLNPFKAGADEVWVATSSDTKFGEFSAADLGMFEKILEGHEARIARTARIPQHFLLQGGTPPSGETLKTAEAPFVSKVKARQRRFGSTWSALMEFLLSLRGYADCHIKVFWASAESRDETNELRRQTIKVGLGVSKKQVLRELGYSAEKIETFEEENAEDARTTQRYFDEGLIPE